MPEVLEHPACTPYFTDPENARQAGLRSAELAKQRQQELDNLRLIIATKPMDEIAPPNAADLVVQQQIRLADELIAHARERINSKECYCKTCERSGITDKDKAALIREIRGLMEHICRLRNIAQAPTSKAPSKPQVTRQTAPEPVIPCVPGPTPATQKQHKTT